MEKIKKTRNVEKSLQISAPIERVWKAITEAKELQRWFPTDATVEPGQGGKIKLSWNDLYIWEFDIESWEENEHLRISYRQNQDIVAPEGYAENRVINIPQELAVDYYLSSEHGVTTLRLVHSGFGISGEWDEEYDGVKRGWNSELSNLKLYLENHFGEDRTLAWASYKPEHSYEEVWKRMSGVMNEGVFEGLNEGDDYSFIMSNGEKYSGTVLFHNPGWDFVASLNEKNNGMLRIKQERLIKTPEVHIMLSSYQLPKEEVQEFEDYWNLRLEEIYSS